MQRPDAARGSGTSLPWIGLTALTLAFFGSALLLEDHLSLRAIFQTWQLTRSSGIVAFLLLWASVSLGLLQSSGYLKGLTAPAANIDLHEFLSLASIHAAAFHAVILLWDRYVPFSLTAILVPFAGSYKPLLVGLGTISLYVMLLATLTTFYRNRINPKGWRLIHQSTLAAFLAALLHGLLLGTDSRLFAVAFMYRFAGLTTLLLLVYRVYKGVSLRAGAARGR